MGTFAAYEIGTLCNFKTTPRNVPVVNWQLGFGDVYVSRKNKQFNVNLVSINHGRFVVSGVEYGARR